MKRRIVLDQQGLVMVFVAIGLLMFLAIVALVVDLGHGLTVRTELQRVADAAALAGAGQLNGTDAGVTAAKAEAITYAAKNKAAGYPVVVLPEDVQGGFWDMPTQTFDPILPGDLGYPLDVNAIQVTTRRDTSSGTELDTVFARIFGRSTMDVTTDAIAQVGGPSQCVRSDDPELDCVIEIPIALCANKLLESADSNFCQFKITVRSEVTQYGAWTTYYDTSPSARDLRNLVNDPELNAPNVYARASACERPECSTDPPPVEDPSGSVIKLTDGTNSSVFMDLRDRYYEMVEPCYNMTQAQIEAHNEMLISNDEKPLRCEDADNDAYFDETTGEWYDYEWKTFIAVICCNEDDPTRAGSACVSGFARFNLEEVCSPAGSDPCFHYAEEANVDPGTTTNMQAVYGFLECGEEGSGGNLGFGGGFFGAWNPNPGLVE
jgi:hypothetical protein